MFVCRQGIIDTPLAHYNERDAVNQVPFFVDPVTEKFEIPFD